MRLGERNWPEVPRGAHLLIPLGSTEQHGPHLPLDTDSRIAVAVAEGAAQRLEVVVAPAVAYGASGEHADFAGTLSLGTEVLRSLIIELVRSAALSFARTTLVNGHGGNVEAVTAAVAQLSSEGHRVTSWSPSMAGNDAHAGRTETSLMLAIAPGQVRLDLASAGNTAPLRELIADLRTGGVAAVSPNGVLGDPAGANATEGQALLARLVDDLVASVVRSTGC